MRFCCPGKRQLQRRALLIEKEDKAREKRSGTQAGTAFQCSASPNPSHRTQPHYRQFNPDPIPRSIRRPTIPVDTEQTVHVMVPDREAPTWSGDLPINPLNLRLLECCDGRSMALFKQLVRESAFEVDWNVRISRVSANNSTAYIAYIQCNGG